MGEVGDMMRGRWVGEEWGRGGEGGGGEAVGGGGDEGGKGGLGGGGK